ncbi:MAG: hypothetical protein KGL96_02950, partial [Hyphomicrobiales bacterium]|nr:hypothetical protein [Hyphomicrobiales bacterium]
LVYTDKEVFEDTDSLTRFKWNSSDIYGELKSGCTYDAKVFGFRNHFLSMYRDIISVQQVPTAACPLKAPQVG